MLRPSETQWNSAFTVCWDCSPAGGARPPHRQVEPVVVHEGRSDQPPHLALGDERVDLGGAWG